MGRPVARRDPGAKPLRIFTWHVHGSYLYYLVARSRHEFFIPVKPDRPQGYGGRAGDFPWPDNVYEVPVDEVNDLDFDCVLFQSHGHYLEDRRDILSEAQRALPRIFLEHDPPRAHPTDTKHPVDDPDALLVHVTHFNDLMWDPGRTPTRVIRHGVVVPDDVSYSGEIERAVAVVNGMDWRGRRVGSDILERVRSEVPVDLVGMGSERVGGLGEVPPPEMPAFVAHYRVFFNPIRYTSLGLAVCEAMMTGMPIVAPATTEMSVVVQNGVSGYVDTDVGRLVEHVRRLLRDRTEAERLGAGARAFAREHFNIERFAAEWDDTFEDAARRLQGVRS